MKINRFPGACLFSGAMIVALSSYGGPKFEQNIDKSFAVTPGGQLVIVADRGTIHVVAGSSDKLEIHVLRKIEDGDKAKADELFARHEVTFTQDGNTVRVVAKDKKRSAWGWNNGRQNLEVRYEISAPSQFNMDLTTAGGDITLDDLDGKLDAETSSGTIHAGSITGSLVARNAGGNIVVKTVGQDAKASTTSGSIEIQKTGGGVEASDAGGDIRIAEAGAGIVSETTSGSITIESAIGDIKATDAGGDIRITRVGGRVAAHTTSGAINIGTADGVVVATDAGGDIHLGTCNANVSAETTSGTIGIGSVKGDSLKADDQGGNIEIGHASGSVSAHTTSGSISIELADGPVEAQDAGGDIHIGKAGENAEVRTTSGSIRIGSAHGRVKARDAGGSIRIDDAGDAVDVETTSGAIDVSFLTALKSDSRLTVLGGDISVSAPSAAALDVDARSEGGSVESELPITIHGKSQNGELQGQINGGGTRLSLHCTSGDIRLKKSSATPIGKQAAATH